MDINNITSKDPIQILLTLLGKSEQILSLLNLPDNIIHKYNQLKELTFEKLNLDYKPLQKLNKSSKLEPSVKMPATNELSRLRIINTKKTVILEYIFDLIDKFKFEKNQYMNNFLLENFSFQLMDKLQQINVNYHNYDDFEFDMKLEEIKLKDIVGKAEIFHKKFLTNLKMNNAESPTRFKQKSKYEESYDHHNENKHFEEIIRDYEKRLDSLRINHEKEIRDYKERFEELRLKYRPDLEAQFNTVKESMNEQKYVLEKVNDLLTTVYDKYYQNNLNWFKENTEFKYKELEKLNFLINLINKFFNDNKYLIELISELQKEKNNLIEERNLPFVTNVINKNNMIVEINDDLKNYEIEFKKNNENFNEIINYINKHFSNLID